MSETIGKRVDEIIEIKDAEILRFSKKLEEYQARVKELEVELGKLKKAYEVVSAYATHFTPDHKLEDKLKEENEAYE